VASLSDTAEDRALNWLTGNSTTAPTLPLKVALVTANGTDSAAGTEVTGGSYTRQNITFAASSGGTAANATDVTFTGLPAATIVGIELWDSAGTPVRWWHGPLTANRTTQAGDELRLAAGDVDLTIS
jgi:hypothetical protein